MPRVSVIVPNYNHEHYLPRRLETIFNQSYQPSEIILLDDCSTDNSLSIIKQYRSDPRVKIVVNANNSGSPFKQWNKGIELCTGDYIWIAESDDYAAPKLLETLVGRLNANPEIGVAYCQSWITKADGADTTGGMVERWYQDLAGHDRWSEDFENDGATELAQYMIFKNTIPNASAVVFRRTLLEGGLQAQEDMRLAGDWMFWAELLLKSGVAYVAKPLNFFRIAHEESQRGKTAKDGLQLMEGLQVYERIVNAVPVTADIRHAVLKYQVKIWGYYAYTRKYALETNRRIFRQLVAHHPETASHPYRLVMLPFVYYFTAVPFRRILIFRVPFRALKWLFLRLRGGPTAEGLGQ